MRLHEHGPAPYNAETLLSQISFLTSWPVLIPLALFLSLLRRLATPGSSPFWLWSIAELVNRHVGWLVWLYVLPLLKLWNARASERALNGSGPVTRPDWSEQVVVVTGASSGIGKEIVQMLGKGMTGVRVAILDVSQPPAHLLSSANVKYFRTNVGDPDSVAAAAEAIRETWGEPTMIVNNAGVACPKKILDLTAAEFERTLRVNLVGSFNVVKAFLPALASRNSGHILHICSIGAFVSAPQGSDYNASKAGLLAFHEVLTAELTSRMDAPGVRTSVVCPVKVRTEGMGTLAEDHPRPFVTPTLEPWQVAERVVLALDSGKSQGVIFVPSHLAIASAIRAFPAWLRRRIRRVSGSDLFATDETVARAVKAGYRLKDD